MDLETLRKVSYGIYIVSSRSGEKINGQIANTLFQITSEPVMVAVSISRANLTHEFISDSKVFAVSILAKDTPLIFIGQFGFKSGREIDKFSGVKYRLGATGAPIVLDNSVAYLEADVVDKIDCGTHTIFVGKVREGEVLQPSAEPMTYAYYHDVKRGTSPVNAPTYIKEQEQGRGKGMKKYVCQVCGYIYDPEKGDPEGGITAGTPFEKLPVNWVCPVCGAGKDQFEEVK